MNKNIVSAIHGSTKLTREKIWYPEKPHYPQVRRKFSELPRPGYVGDCWKAGGCVLVGSNGNSAEGNKNADLEYKEQDRQHAKLIRAFRDAPGKETFTEFMAYEKQDVQGWSLYPTIKRVVERREVGISDIAVLNVIPFSSKDSPCKSSPVWKNSVTLHLAPLLKALQPDHVIWLGKAAEKRGGVHLYIAKNVKFHTVSRQQNLTWEKKLDGLPSP